MQRIITLIAAADAETALADIAGDVGIALKAEPDWLAPGRACDLPLAADRVVEAEAVARRAIGTAPIDVLVQPALGRRKRILVADLESTIIENEMLDELADYVGRRAEVAEITRRAMNGEIDFVGSLQQRVALLKGLPATVLDEAAARIRLMPGAQTLIGTMHALGTYTALVTSGFAVFAEPVAARLGFDRVVANRLDIEDGRIAGTVVAPVLTGETKRDTLLRLADQRGVPLEETLAIGDGANDRPMLAAAGLGIAFHAKPTVAAASRWRLDHADLTGVLYAQGVRSTEFVA